MVSPYYGGSSGETCKPVDAPLGLMEPALEVPANDEATRKALAQGRLAATQAVANAVRKVRR